MNRQVHTHVQMWTQDECAVIIVARVAVFPQNWAILKMQSLEKLHRVAFFWATFRMYRGCQNVNL